MGKIKDYVIPIVVGGFALIAVLITPSSFLIHPNFQINVTQEDNQMKKIEVINDGWIQGKNVRMNIISDAQLNVTQIDCPEGVKQQYDNKNNVLNFEMERMSAQLPCDITVRPTNNEISKVIVTALDSPASQWKQETPVAVSLSYSTEYIKLAYGLILSIVVYAVVRRFIRYVHY